MTDGLTYTRKLCKLIMDVANDDHFHALGMRFRAVQQGFVSMELPYSEELVGNPETGVLHGGALTALLDTCCGFAASSAIDEFAISPTLDLRIDYMRPAEPQRPIYADAKVYRSTRHVIFCRGKAYQENSDEPVAFCVATFARVDTDVQQEMEKQIKPFLDTVESTPFDDAI